MSKELTILDKSEVLLLKGVAIILIVTHNFFHWVEPVFGENEFSFNPNIATDFIELIINGKINIVHAILSFIGHYGVQIFIFCSAYGLTVKYKNSVFSKVVFLKQRVFKLYPTFTIALFLLLVYNYFVLNLAFDNNTVKLILLRYSLLANLFPGKAFIVCGPFWFYSMIFQFYLVFPFLLKLVNKQSGLIYILILVSLIVNFLINDTFDSYNFSLYYNLIGNLPVLLLGMIATGFNIRKLFCWPIIILSIIVFTLSQYYSPLWYFSQIAFLSFSIPLILKFFKVIKSVNIKNSVLHIGKLSMYLFAVHGFLRLPWVTNSNYYSESVFGNLALYIIVVYLVAYSTRNVESRIIRYF